MFFATAFSAAAEGPAFVDLEPADGTLVTAGEVTLAGCVDGAVKLVIDGEEVAVDGGSFRAGPYQLPEGDRVFLLIAEDAEGHRSERLHRIVRDTRGPAILVSEPARSVVSESPVVVKGTAADPHLAEVLVDGHPAALDGASFAASLELAEGPRTVVIEARDAAGNSSRQELRLTLDTRPPTVDVRVHGKALADGSSFSGAVRPEVAAGDGERLEVRLNGAPFEPGGEISAEGAYRLTVRATDEAGHVTVRQLGFAIDRTPPVIAPFPKSLTVTSPRYVAEGRVSGAAKVTVDGRAAQLAVERFTAGPFDLAPGLNVLTVEASDAAGNTSTAQLTVKVDTTGPAITIASPPDGAVVGSSPIAVSGTVTDEGVVTDVRVDATVGTLNGDQFTVSGVALAEGSNALTVEATDDSANTSQAGLTVTLDTTAPAIQILAGGSPLADGAFFAGLVTPVIEVTDATEVTLTSTLDSIPWTSNTSVTSAGAHLLEVTATDAAGNAASASVTFTVEATPPVFETLTPADGTVQSASTVTLTGRVTGAASLTVDGQAVSLVGQDFIAGPYALAAEQTTTFTLVATSAGGQTTTATRTVTHDGTAPALAISTPPEDDLGSSLAITVTGTASDPHLDTVTVNGTVATVSAGTWTATQVSLREGANVLAARAVDTAGNVTEASRAVVVDTREPEVTITDPEPGTIVGAATYTVRGTVSDAHLDRVEVAGQAATLTGDTWTIEVALSAGDNPVLVEAFDTLGHRGEASVTVRREDGAPEVHIDVPAEGLHTQASTVDVSGTVTAGATVTVNGDAATVTGTAFSLVGVELLDGEDVIRARATGDGGLEGIHTRTVWRDTTPPEYVSSEPLDGAEVAPGSHFVVTFSEEMAEPVAGAWSLELADGTPLAATATLAGAELTVVPSASLPPASTVELELTPAWTDLAGNTLSAATTLSFTTPGTQAGAVQLDPVPLFVCAASWSLSGTAPAGALVEVTGGAANASVRAAADGTWSVEVALAPDTLHRLSVVATDVDGNATAPVSADVAHDCRAPEVVSADRQGNDFVVTFSEPVDGSTASSAITVSASGGPLVGSVSSSGSQAAFSPSSAPPSEALLLEVSQQVTDLAGNALAYPFSKLFDDSPEESFLSGTVIHDATGRPLSGARVTVTATDGVALSDPLPEQTTGADGHFLVPVPAGTHDVTIARPGYTPVFRIATASTGVGTELFAPRLTPASEPESVGTSGGTVSVEGGASLVVPSGALAAATDVALSPVGEQGLAALLPYGWSPRGAVWLDVDSALQAAASLSFPVESPDGTLLTVAELDLGTLQWKSLGDVAVSGGAVTVNVDALGAYAALEADTGAVAPPSPIAGEVLGSSPAPLGTEVTAATVTFDPEVVLPAQTSLATVIYTLSEEVASGVPLTLVIQEELTLLGGTLRREVPYRADLVLYHTSGGVARSRFRLRPSTTAQTLPIELGAEDVAVELYADESVRGNVLGPEGGTVLGDASDRIDVAAGSLTEPTAVVLTRRTVADLPLAAPAGGTVDGVVEVDLGGTVLLSPARITLAMETPPSAGEVGLLLEVVDVGGTPRYRAVAELEPSSAGWASKAIDPNDLPWPGVRDSGQYVFVRLAVAHVPVTGIVWAVDHQPLIGGIVSSPEVEWIQLTDGEGRFVLPVPPGTITIDFLDTDTRNATSNALTIQVGESRVDVEPQIAIVAPTVVETSPLHGAVVPAGIQPTVRFSEPVDVSSVASGIQLLLDGKVIPVAFDVQGTLVTVLPQTTLAPGVAYDLRVTTAIRDLQGYALLLPYEIRFSITVPVFPTEIDRSKISLLEPDALGQARVLGLPGALPADSTYFVENLTSFAATVTEAAAQDGSFDISVDASLGDRLLFHVLRPEQNEVFFVLQLFMTEDRRGAYIGPEGGELTTIDGWTLVVPPETFLELSRLRVEPFPTANVAVPVSEDLAPHYAFRLELEAEPRHRLGFRLPAPAGATASQTFIVERVVEVLDRRGWMLQEILGLDGMDLTNLDSNGNPPGKVGPLPKSSVSQDGGIPTKLASPQDYLAGLSDPGEYVVVSADDPISYVAVPAVGVNGVAVVVSADWPGQVAYATALIEGFPGQYAILPAPLNSLQSYDVVELSSGYTVYTGVASDVAEEFHFIPTSLFDDQKPPYPAAGTPFRFFLFKAFETRQREIDDHITQEVSNGDLIVVGEDGATEPEAPVRLIGLDDGVAFSQDANLLGAFSFLQPVVAGNRYLLVIGAGLQSGEPLEIRFSEELDYTAQTPFEILDSLGTSVTLTIEQPGSRAYRLRPESGWKTGEQYTWRLKPELADLNGNAWNKILEIPFTVSGFTSQTPFSLGFVRDVARMGDLLFVAADSQGLMLLDASDPNALSSYIPGDHGFKLALDDPVRGVTIDPHGRVIFVGGGTTGHGQVKILDPLAISQEDIADLATNPSTLRFLLIMSDAIRGGTLISDPLGNNLSNLREGQPRRVVVLSNDKRNRWAVDPAALEDIDGATLTLVGSPTEESTLVIDGTDGIDGNPVTVRNRTLGIWDRVDAESDGTYTLAIRVREGDDVELLRNVSSTAYVAVDGIGIATVDVNSFYDFSYENFGVTSWITGILDYLEVPNPAGSGCDAMPPENPFFTDLELLPGTESHPATLTGLLWPYGVVVLGIEGEYLNELELLSSACGAVDGVALMTGMDVVSGYGFDYDGDGKIRQEDVRDDSGNVVLEKEVGDFVVATNGTGWLLVYDVTDRSDIRLVGKVKLPGSPKDVVVDAVQRRLLVSAGDGIYVVDFNPPPSTEVPAGDDPRVVETLPLAAGATASALLVPELGLGYIGTSGGLARGVYGTPLFQMRSHDLTKVVPWIAPYGAPSGQGTGAIRLFASLPGAVGTEIEVDLVSTGPSGKEIQGPGVLAGSSFPPTSLRGANALVLYRLSNNPLDDAYNRFLSEPVVSIADLRAAKDYALDAEERESCTRCEPENDLPEYLVTSGSYREILSGDWLELKIPTALRQQLSPIYGNLLLDRAELKIRSVPWRMSPPKRQEPTVNPSRGTGDVAPGTLLHSGEMTLTDTDLVVSRRGFPFSMVRTYRSQTLGSGMLGPGWTHGYEISLRFLPDKSVELYDGNGRVERFELKTQLVEQNGESRVATSWEAPRGRFLELIHPEENVWIVIDERARKLTFDSFGRLIVISDVLAEGENSGNQMRFQYDSHSRLSAVVDTLDKWYDFEYDEEGRLARIIDPESRTVEYTYDALGRLVSVRSPIINVGDSPFPSGLVKQYEYTTPAGGYAEQLQTRDNLTAIIDPRGQRWLEMVYTDADGDGYANEVTTQTWGGHSLQIAYDFANRRTTVTDRRQNTWVYDHNQAGQVTSITDPTGAVTIFEYNYDGLLTRQVNPLGRVVEKVYEEGKTRRSRSNLLQVVVRPDSRGANGSSEELVTAQTFHDRTNQVVETAHPWGATSLAERDRYGRATQVTDAAGSAEESAVQYDYNVYGQKTRMVNPNDHEMEYTYSDDGYLEAKTVDPGGLNLVTQFETDARGNVTARIDPRGVRHEYVYNEVDWLVEERVATTGSSDGAPALNYVVEYLYDENGNVVEKKIPYGDGSSTTSTRYEYDILNNVTAVEEDVEVGGALFIRETREFDENFNLKKVVDPEGHVTELTYDSRNLVETETRGFGTPEASTTTHTYDAEGQVTTILDGRDETWTTEYDGYGRVMKEIDPLGNYTTRTYDDAGNVKVNESYDAYITLLARTEVGYDLLNRAKTRKSGHWFEAETYPDVTTSVDYDAASNVLTSTDERQLPTTYVYDAAERLYQTTDSMGNVSSMTLDGNGNVISVSETDVLPDGSSVQVTRTYTYDALGRLIETTESDGRTWGTEYDARGNVAKEVDPELNETIYEYDGLNRLVKVSRPENVQVDYGYDLASRMVSYRDALNQTTSYTYDALNRPLTVTYPDNTVVSTLAYDGNDNPLQVQDARGNVMAQTFDDANRLVGRTITLAVGVGGVSAESFAYDGLDRLTSVTSGVTVTRAYDSLSRLRRETIDGKTVLYGYDDASNLEGLTYPSLVNGQPYQVTYQNDSLNRRSQVSSAAGPIADYGYRGPYLLAQKSLYGPGPSPVLDAGLSYDPTRRLLRKQFTRASDSATVFDENLTWYARNLKQSSTRDDLDGRQLTYTYDGADRLTDVQRQVVVPTCEKGLPTRWTYGYDVADNLLSKTEERETCDAQKVIDLPLDGSGRNRPGAVDEEALGWDASGNLTNKGGASFQYDYRNRLIRAVVDSVQYDYVYDHFNRRVQKSGAGKIEKTVWAGWQAIETYVNDQLTERRTFGNGLDEIVRIEKLPENATYLPVYDDTGNLVLVTDGSGEPIERYEYSPFGQRFVFADTAPPVVEQVRLRNGEVWLEISEAIDPDTLQQKVQSGELRLTNLDSATDLPITVSLPVTTGRQAHRRLIITTTAALDEGTNVELVVPASALVDHAEQPAAADYVTSFLWQATDFIVDDSVPPRLDTVCLQGDHLEIQFSEEPSLAQIDQVLQVNGLAIAWALGADSYTVVSEPLAGGTYTLTISASPALDLAGWALSSSFTDSFDVSLTAPENEVLFDSPRAGELGSSAIGLLYGFHGRPIDPETGFLYFRNRYYDPELGRFISSDPLGYVDGPSMYQFAGSSPVNLSDPMGLASNYREMGIEEDLVDRPVRGAAKWIGYQAWNFVTFGFLGRHDADYDATGGYWGDRGAYLRRTAINLGRTGLQAGLAYATGGWGARGASTLAGALARGAAGGAASGLVTTGAIDIYDRMTGGEGASFGDYVNSAVSGAFFGALGGGMGWRRGTSENAANAVQAPTAATGTPPGLASVVDDLPSNVLLDEPRSVTKLGRVHPTDWMSKGRWKRHLESVRDIGIQNPEILYVELGGEGYVVWGSNRLEAARITGQLDKLRFHKIELPFRGYKTAEDVFVGAIDARRRFANYQRYRGRR